MSGDPWDDYSNFDPPPAVPVGVQPASEAATSATARAVPTRPEPAEDETELAWQSAQHWKRRYDELAGRAPAVPVVHPEPGDRPMTHHPKCFQSTRTPEQLVAEGLAPDQCDCGTLRLLDAVTAVSAAADLSSWMDTPHRIAVDGLGYVWRAYADGTWSMAPVNPDNSPVPQPVIYYVPESVVAAAVAAVRVDTEAKARALPPRSTHGHHGQLVALNDVLALIRGSS